MYFNRVIKLGSEEWLMSQGSVVEQKIIGDFDMLPLGHELYKVISLWFFGALFLLFLLVGIFAARNVVHLYSCVRRQRS
jgi:hypothetical protein